MTINKAIEKLSVIDLDRIQKRYSDNIIHILAIEIEETITILKSIEKVTGEEIEESIQLDPKTYLYEDMAKHLNRRIWGE